MINTISATAPFAIPITAISAASLTILLIILAILTVRVRISNQIAFGDGDNNALLIASRAHANLAEHAPLGVILILILELSSVHYYATAFLAISFLVARILHAWGMFRHGAGKSPKMRQVSVILTWLSLTAMALWTIFLAFGA